MVAKGVQHDPTTQLTRIPSTRSRGNHAQASVGRKSEIKSGNAIGGRSVSEGVDRLRLKTDDDDKKQKDQKTNDSGTKLIVIIVFLVFYAVVGLAVFGIIKAVFFFRNLIMANTNNEKIRS